MIGFSGSRRLSSYFKPTILDVVELVNSHQQPIAVGCAPGLDSFVRNSPGFAGQVFTSTSHQPSALVKRSVDMVRTVAGSPYAALLIWPGGGCPAGLMPSRIPSQCFCGLGSGTWASAALAVGLGVPVYAFGVGILSLPESWGFWSSTRRFPHCRSLTPSEFVGAQQLSLFHT